MDSAKSMFRFTRSFIFEWITSETLGFTDNACQLEPLEDTWSEEELTRTIEFRYEKVVLYVDERELIGELP